MEPQIQYTKTADGVSIAWAEAGQGPALLFCTFTPFSHVQEQVAVYRESFEAFSRSFRLITFDARGTGMSERDVASVSAETLLLDAEAVLDAAKLDRVIVNADGSSILATSTCLRLAIQSPERVTHVILDAPFENARELADTPFGRTNLALAELDWTVYTQTLFRVLLGLSASNNMIESYVVAVGGWVDPIVGVRYIREWEAVDLGDLLPQVRQPTLVTRNDPFFVPARCCQRVAAKIPGAQFRQYSDPTWAQMAELIGDFVGQPTAPTPQDAIAASPLRTVLFTDIVGHTAMMQRLGDDAGRGVLREHERITRGALLAHGGTEVKTDGDSFMASFASVSAAVECAISLQLAFAQHSTNADEPIVIRIGLNVGEPIEEDGDFFGSAVILGARIKDQAKGGEILVPQAVRHLLSGKGFLFADRGEVVPKGFEEPVRLYTVRWGEENVG
ncbi:MAG: adenylate/guanylate cyclase domain-containing protein [Dehalococcoidia bacterium]